MGDGHEPAQGAVIPILQARVRMEINALTKHLLQANTSETCATVCPARAEPHSRGHLTTTAFAQVAKVVGAGQKM